MKRLILALCIAAIFGASRSYAGTAGATTAAACGASSTQILTAGDLGTGAPRHALIVCNNGPGLGYVAFGSSNAASALNGLPLEPLQCLPLMLATASPNGVIANPPQLDVACIADGAATANMVALDW
jgi:hypothetical protein